MKSSQKSLSKARSSNVPSRSRRTVSIWAQPRFSTAPDIGVSYRPWLWRDGPMVSSAEKRIPMAEIEDNVDRELFRNIEKLRALRIEHRDLDEVIARLTLDTHSDQLQLKRLKKRKLMLKDQIHRMQ